MRFQGGSLVLDASASFSGLVAGFGTSDQIDLRDVAFVTATTKRGQQSNLSLNRGGQHPERHAHGHDGIHTANIQLLGPIHGERVRRGKRSSSGRRAGSAAHRRTHRHPPARPVSTLSWRRRRYVALSAPLREAASSGLARAAVAWPPQR